MTFKAFPKIKQYRDVINHVQHSTDYRGRDENNEPIFEHIEPYPIIKFRGTPKLHGTNAGILIDEFGNIEAQNRYRTLTLTQDNVGFAAFVAGRNAEILNTFEQKNIVIYGEWCGGNIQKGVALNALSKRFIIFAIKNLSNNEWLNLEVKRDLNEHNIFFINQFEFFEINIDFNQPKNAINKLIEITKNIELECPAGKFFGVSGVGEGCVWKPAETLSGSSQYWFKVKGEKHQSSKVKSLATVDVEKLNSVNEFVDLTVTRNRLEQGIQVLKERNTTIELSNTGEYLKWIVNDILSEELDQLTKNDLCVKDVNKSISIKARKFWFQECAALVGLS